MIRFSFRSRRVRSVAIAAVALSMSPITVACGGDGPDVSADRSSRVPTSVAQAPTQTAANSGATSTARAPEGTARGGRLTVLTNGQHVNYDPQLQRVAFAFSESLVMTAIYGNLAYFEPATGALKLYFLESLEPNSDFTTWTMKLHPDLRFSDGTPLDADAVVFNIERARDPETGSRFREATTGLTATAIDDVTIAIGLDAPDPNWPASLVANFAGIGSPTAIKAAIAAGVEFGSVPVGAGPFRVREWTEPGAQIMLERNPYFESFKPGQPYLDEITFLNVADQNQQVTALQTGAAQMAAPSGGKAAADFGKVANVQITSTSGGANIFLNHTIPPFDDVRARRALWLALDRTGAANAFAEGTPPAASLFAESSPFYDERFLFPDSDPEEAQRLFDELAAEGRPVEFKYTTLPSAAQATMIDFLIAQLAEYDNVTFEPDVRTQDEYRDAGNTGEYQAIAWGTYVITPSPILVDTFHPDGLLNSMGWENVRVGEAMDSLATAGSIEEQREIWNIVQEEMLADVPVVWLGQGLLGVAATADVVVPETINHGNDVVWAEVHYSTVPPEHR